MLNWMYGAQEHSNWEREFENCAAVYRKSGEQELSNLRGTIAYEKKTMHQSFSMLCFYMCIVNREFYIRTKASGNGL